MARSTSRPTPRIASRLAARYGPGSASRRARTPAVLRQPAAATRLLRPEHAPAAVRDVRMRQAVNYAIDRARAGPALGDRLRTRCPHRPPTTTCRRECPATATPTSTPSPPTCQSPAAGTRAGRQNRRALHLRHPAVRRSRRRSSRPTSPRSASMSRSRRSHTGTCCTTHGHARRAVRPRLDGWLRRLPRPRRRC